MSFDYAFQRVPPEQRAAIKAWLAALRETARVSQDPQNPHREATPPLREASDVVVPQGATLDHIFRRVLPEDRPLLEDAVRRSVYEDIAVTYRIQHPESGIRWLHVETGMRRLEDGSPLVLGVVRDITAQKVAEQQRDQEHLEQKMAALNTLTAQLGHELRTPLQGLSAHTELIENLLESGKIEEVRRVLQRIRRHGQQLGDMLGGMRRLVREDYLGRTNVEYAPVQLQTLVKNLTKLRQTQQPQLRWEIAANAPEALVSGVSVHLQMVLDHLLNNACDALAETTDPTITVRLFADEQQVTLQVSDNGHGMDTATQARIFDPFFTTRPIGAGSGLGLPFCRNIITDHQGSLTCQSAPAQGATFTIVLPRLLPVAGEPPTAPDNNA